MSSSTSSSPTQHRDSPFQWNRRGWFGAQIGGTVWLLIGSLALFPAAPLVAIIWLSSFVLCTVLGAYLWAQRKRLRAYAAYQWFFLIVAVLTFVSIAAAHQAGQLPRLVWAGANPQLTAYGALLVFPIIMLQFYLRERSATRTSG